MEAVSMQNNFLRGLVRGVAEEQSEEKWLCTVVESETWNQLPHLK